MCSFRTHGNMRECVVASKYKFSRRRQIWLEKTSVKQLQRVFTVHTFHCVPNNHRVSGNRANPFFFFFEVTGAARRTYICFRTVKNYQNKTPGNCTLPVYREFENNEKRREIDEDPDSGGTLEGGGGRTKARKRETELRFTYVIMGLLKTRYIMSFHKKR